MYYLLKNGKIVESRIDATDLGETVKKSENIHDFIKEKYLIAYEKDCPDWCPNSHDIEVCEAFWNESHYSFEIHVRNNMGYVNLRTASNQKGIVKIFAPCKDGYTLIYERAKKENKE